MSEPVRSDSTPGNDIKKARLTFIFSLIVLVVITFVVVRYSTNFGISELTGLGLVWVTVGWLAFFAGSQAYSSGSTRLRPYLTVGRGIPAWSFFIGGSALIVAVASLWLASGNYRSGLLLAGVAVMYASMAFPRPLSVRRAAVGGIGLLISGIGLVFF